MRLRVTALLLAGLALLSCLPTRNAMAEETAAKHFLWKITGTKGTVYLFGTIHIGKPDFYPLSRTIEDSFKRSDVLVEEVKSEPSDAALMKRWLVEHGIYPGSDTIGNHLTEETIRHLAIYLKQKSWREQQVISKMRPWAIAAMISEGNSKRLGLDPANGLDKHFLAEAQEQHKPVEALETVASQLQLLSELTSSLEDDLLMQSLAEAEKPNSFLEMLVAAWRLGDADRMQELLSKNVSDHPRLKPIMKKLLDDRNDAMSKQIEQFLATPKTYFVAVGAGHLVGEHGILSQLRAKQFPAEQL